MGDDVTCHSNMQEKESARTGCCFSSLRGIQAILSAVTQNLLYLRTQLWNVLRTSSVLTCLFACVCGVLTCVLVSLCGGRCVCTCAYNPWRLKVDIRYFPQLLYTFLCWGRVSCWTPLSRASHHAPGISVPTSVNVGPWAAAMFSMLSTWILRTQLQSSCLCPLFWAIFPDQSTVNTHFSYSFFLFFLWLRVEPRTSSCKASPLPLSYSYRPKVLPWRELYKIFSSKSLVQLLTEFFILKLAMFQTFSSCLGPSACTGPLPYINLPLWLLPAFWLSGVQKLLWLHMAQGAFLSRTVWEKLYVCLAEGPLSRWKPTYYTACSGEGGSGTRAKSYLKPSPMTHELLPTQPLNSNFTYIDFLKI